MKEIYFLQSSTSKALFEMGMRLFRQKYSQFSSTRPFINDFFSRFVDLNSNWFEAYDVFCPSTNNSLENFNCIIKKKYLGWNQLTVTQFIDTSIKILSEESMKVPILHSILYESAETESINFNFIFIKAIADKNFYLVTKNDSLPSDLADKFLDNYEISMIFMSFIPV